MLRVIWDLLYNFKRCEKQPWRRSISFQCRKTHKFPLIYKMSCFSCLVFSCVCCFFLKTMKLYKYICFAWVTRTSADFFFFTDWRQKRLKNKTDLLLFYGEHFYGFSEGVLVKMVQVVPNFAKRLFYSTASLMRALKLLTMQKKYNGHNN